ncbi:MAG: S8 family serine peptidase [Coriobacteriia bacterium]|nr:S8 family serine peptidase [Coriobacteriia bacterium]
MNINPIGVSVSEEGVAYSIGLAIDAPLFEPEDNATSVSDPLATGDDATPEDAKDSHITGTTDAGEIDYSGMEYEDDVVLVKPMAGVNEVDIAAALGVDSSSVISSGSGLMEVRLANGMSVEDAVATLQEHEGIATAQPDFIYHLQDELDDATAADDMTANETPAEGSADDEEAIPIDAEEQKSDGNAGETDNDSVAAGNETPTDSTVATDPSANNLEAEPDEEITEDETPLAALEEEPADENDTADEEDSTTPDDPKITKQWALNSINAFKAWKLLGEGDITPTTVAIMDDGIDATHEDLVGSLKTDSDGNIIGYNTCDGTNDISQVSGSDHGTHVAGIIAAQANNGVGVAGTSFNQQILPIRIIDDSGYSHTSDLVAAFDYVRTHAVEYNIRVVNLSVGVTGSSAVVDSLLKDSIDQAYGEQGVVTVASAGNGSSSDELPTTNYPSDYDHIVAVISLQENLANEDGVSRSPKSNYNQIDYETGELEEAKDIAAPGAEIYSTIPNSKYGYKSGTSMAAPCVSGVLAMMFAVNPSMSAQQVVELLLHNTRDINEPGFDAETGYGEVDAAAAVEAALTEEGSFEPVPVLASDPAEQDPVVDPDAGKKDPTNPTDTTPGKAEVPTPLYVIGATKMPVSSTSAWKLKNCTMKVVSGEGVVSIAKDGVTVKAKTKGTATLAIYNKAGKKVKTQKVKVYNLSGSYTLNSAKKSMLCVSVKRDSKRVNAAAVVSKKVGKASQAVKFVRDNGYYRVKMVGSKKYLAAKGASKKAGAAIVQVEKSSSKAQQWKITVDKKNRLTFTNRKSGKVLRIKGDIASGSVLIQANPTTALYAKWIPTR